MLRGEGEEYISWDFDDTLYDTKTQSLNMQLVETFNEQIKAGKNVCIVTLRTFQQCKHVRYLFPNVRIFYTNGQNKVRYLRYQCPVKIVKHYDDRLDTCLGLLETGIIPVWCFGQRVKANIQKLEIRHFKEC